MLSNDDNGLWGGWTLASWGPLILRHLDLNRRYLRVDMNDDRAWTLNLIELRHSCVCVRKEIVWSLLPFLDLHLNFLLLRRLDLEFKTSCFQKDVEFGNEWSVSTTSKLLELYYKNMSPPCVSLLFKPHWRETAKLLLMFALETSRLGQRVLNWKRLLQCFFSFKLLKEICIRFWVKWPYTRSIFRSQKNELLLSFTKRRACAILGSPSILKAIIELSSNSG